MLSAHPLRCRVAINNNDRLNHPMRASGDAMLENLNEITKRVSVELMRFQKCITSRRDTLIIGQASEIVLARTRVRTFACFIRIQRLRNKTEGENNISDSREGIYIGI